MRLRIQAGKLQYSEAMSAGLMESNSRGCRSSASSRKVFDFR